MSCTWSTSFPTQAVRFGQNTSGGIATIFALVFVPLMAAAGVAVDFTVRNSTRSAMQAALDAAALNVVKDAAALGSSEVTLKAMSVFTATFNRPEAQSVEVSAAFDSQNSTLTVNASALVPMYFMGVFGINSMQISGLSKARNGADAGACVIALDGEAPKSFEVSGSGNVSVPNCGIYVNSTSSSALDKSGSGWIKTKSIHVAGGATSGNYSPQPKVKQPKTPDPLADIPEPTVPANCTYTDEKFANAGTIPGGSVYCGQISFNANMIFGAGIHYFKNAEVKTVSNVKITGDNVMLYFDDASTWDTRGTGYLQLKAPQSGTYSGIAMFGTRTGSMSTFKVNGGKDYFINGSLYLPTVRLELYGDVDVSSESKSGYVIAKQFYYQGKSNFVFDAFGGAIPAKMVPPGIALVQ